MTKDRPKAPIKMVEARLYRTVADHSVFVRVVYEDANGKKWHAEYASFTFDLEPGDGSDKTD